MKLEVILVILMCSFVISSDYEYSKSLDFDVELEGDIEVNGVLTKTTDGDKNYFVNTELYLFPRDGYIQEVISLNSYSEPDSEIRESSSKISYRWYEYDSDLTFGYKSKVRTYNKIFQLTEKIPFPPHKFDSSFDKYLEFTDNIDFDEDIKYQTNEIVSGETDYYIALFKLASWVNKNIKYDKNQFTEEVVQPSSWVLENKQGVCDEITNLFISMCRSVGIPARFIRGVAYSGQEFGRHGWAEVYFPDKGWIPFDVTYGQYGWIDPTHIKLREELDSGEPSVTYEWNLGGKKIFPQASDNISVKVVNVGERKGYQMKLDINPVVENVNVGSYVPVEIYVENIKPYYLPVTIDLIKAPGIYDNQTRKKFLLQPYEKKKSYFIIPISDKVIEGYFYSSIIEVITNFGQTAQTTIKCANSEFEDFTLNRAEEIVKKYEERDSKSYFYDLSLDCSLENDFYYYDEEVRVNCLIRNEGNVMLEGLEICGSECYNYDLQISQEEDAIFLFEKSNLTRLSISAESDSFFKEENIFIQRFDFPLIEVSWDGVKELSYSDSVKGKFYLNSNSPVYDVVFEWKGEKENIGNFIDGYSMDLEFTGKEVYKNRKIKVYYKDARGIEYLSVAFIDITVEDIPFFAKLFGWLF